MASTRSGVDREGGLGIGGGLFVVIVFERDTGLEFVEPW